MSQSQITQAISPRKPTTAIVTKQRSIQFIALAPILDRQKCARQRTRRFALVRGGLENVRFGGDKIRNENAEQALSSGHNARHALHNITASHGRVHDFLRHASRPLHHKRPPVYTRV